MAGFCPVAASPRPPERAFDSPVGGVVGPACSPRVLRDQLTLDKIVEFTKVNVTENRRYHTALRASAQRFVILPVLQEPGFQHAADKPQEPLVVDFSARILVITS